MRVRDFGVELIVMELHPGVEAEVARTAARRPDTRVFKAFGKYDLLILRKGCDVPGETDILVDCAEKMVDFEQELFYVPDAEANAPLPELPDTDWLMFTLLKIGPASLHQTGTAPLLVLERTIAALSEVVSDTVACHHVLGGLGWHELALLMFDNDVERLAQAVVRVGEKCPAVQKSFTLVGLDAAYITEERDWAAPAGAPGQPRRVRPNLLVSGRGGAVTDLGERLSDRFASGGYEVIFGSEDLLVRPEGDLVAFTQRLLEQRRDPANTIHSTSTLVSYQPPRQAGSGPAAGPARGAPPSQPPWGAWLSGLADVVRAGTTLDGVSADLRQLYRQFQAVMVSSVSNPLVADAYLDMLPALAGMGRLHGQETTTERRSVKWRDLLHYLSLAYQQRCLGTSASLWNAGNPVPMFYRSGIHMILRAVEYVIDTLLCDPDGQPGWSGFATFGITRDYLRTHLGVVNLPARVLLKPGEWWGVFHEAGHEYFYRRFTADRDSWYDAVRELAPCRAGHDLGAAAPAKGAPQHEMEKHLRDLWECLSDLFDLRVGFGRVWEDYLEVLLDYLLRTELLDSLLFSIGSGYLLEPGSYAAQELTHYLVRLLVAQLDVKGVRSAPAAEEAIPVLLDAVAPWVTKWTRSAAAQRGLGGQEMKALEEQAQAILSPSYIYEAFENSIAFRLLLTPAGQDFLGAVLPDAPEPTAPDASIDLILDGCTSATLKAPHRVVARLAKSPGSWASNTAFMLSCWNQYTALLPARLGPLVGQ